MKVMPNNIMPHIRELPFSLKLNNGTKYAMPIKNDGYIIDPRKFQHEIKEVDLKEIKTLLLMMLKGNNDFISELIKPGNNRFVDTTA
ncbi:MAG: hypothetical protein KKH98_10750 [Spirochaetes bacterium]|nr:hypothetical protein [Spirochaetota bacterium]